MTREEAIKEIKNMAKFNYTLAPTEVFDMAIKALEQEPCEDVVSRQSMLDAITEIDDNINMDIYTNEVREIIGALPSVTPTQKWIPVSERLPKENGGYFVTVKRGYVTTALWNGVTEYWNEVIAWMPLPEPYKAEMESEE